MNRPVFAHTPYHLLRENIGFAVANRINPELFFSGAALDTLLPEELAAVADSLAANGMQCTIHAPFIDLNPGSPERLVREATMYRFNQVLDAAEILRPRVMVFHPGYDRWRYGDQQDTWLSNCLASFDQVLVRAERIGCTIAVENIFEDEPSTLRALLEAIDSPLFRHCFDVGHWKLFHKVGMEEWFAELGEFIAEVHVHDNNGRRDDHLPIGEGTIDFGLYFSLMKRYAPDALYTVEAHDRHKVLQAITNLRAHLEA